MNDGHHGLEHDRAFAIGVILNLGFVVVEASFGVLADSLALLADAAHNLGDVLGLLLAWGATVLARLRPTKRRTYGWRSSTILAALLNAVILLVAVGGIASEAIRRLDKHAPVTGKTVIVVAAAGIVMNLATARLLRRGGKGDLNIRGAFLHMVADAGVSAGVVVAGVGMLTMGWGWLDPVTSLFVGGVVLAISWRLLRESVNLALQAVPEGIDPERVRRYLCGLPGVMAVHDLHIWAMSTTQTALTAHLVKPEPADDDAVISQATEELHERFGIEHTTLQWEREGSSGACETCCDQDLADDHGG
jgi:cobalt-zinc-cadmium efflux system protein